MSIHIEDEDNFPDRVHHANHKFDSVYTACRALRAIERGSVVIALEDMPPGDAQRRAHVAFRYDPRWKVVTRVRNGELKIRKELRNRI